MSQWAGNGICTAVTGYPSSPTLGTGTTHLWGPILFLVTKSSLVWIVQGLVSQLLFRERHSGTLVIICPLLCNVSLNISNRL